MKLQPFIDRLSESNAYKDFQKKNKDAFLMAGFFVFDLESGESQKQIDYYVPSKKKIAAFNMDKQVTFQLLDAINNKTPEKLESKTKIDLDALPGILEDEMKNRSITESIQKIIVVLQTIDGKRIWNLNCLLTGMTVLNAHVDDESETVLKMEKKSLMDIVKHMPTQLMPQQGMPGQQPAAPVAANGANGEGGEEAAGQAAIQNAEEKIKKLQELEDAIEKEKAAIAQKAPSKVAKSAKKEKKK